MTKLPANHYVVSGHYRSYRLDRFLQAMIPKLSRARIQSAIRERVSVSWHPRPRPSLTVVPGGEVTIFFPEVVEPDVPAMPRTIHEDDAILVADKPAGLLVHPTHSCLKNNLVHLLRAEHPGVPLALAHRLDRDTSGVIVLTKTVDAARALAAQFEKREIEKTYLAAVHGRVRPLQGTIDAPLGVSRSLQVIFRRSTDGQKAQHAETRFRTLGRGPSASLVMLTPRTGRRHQLRAHLAAIGHPIAGDRLYGLSDRDFLKHLRGVLNEDARRALLADRQLLHAHRLRLRHPATGRLVTFTSPMPEDMKRFLDEQGVAPRPGLPKALWSAW
jgi:23S rRNA pseudouridine1911/1915/1917 synthase